MTDGACINFCSKVWITRWATPRSWRARSMTWSSTAAAPAPPWNRPCICWPVAVASASSVSPIPRPKSQSNPSPWVYRYTFRFISAYMSKTKRFWSCTRCCRCTRMNWRSPESTSIPSRSPRAWVCCKPCPSLICSTTISGSRCSSSRSTRRR